MIGELSFELLDTCVSRQIKSEAFSRKHGLSDEGSCRSGGIITANPVKMANFDLNIFTHIFSGPHNCCLAITLTNVAKLME